MLKCNIDFGKLATLDLRTISIGTVLRLNGPGSLQGAENIRSLALTVSIQFADRPLVEKAEIAFSDLLDALDCRALRSLKISFINDGYHIGDDLTTELSASYFLDQLHIVEDTLNALSITLETTDDDGELDWLIDMCQHPVKTMKGFSALKSLVVPQSFIFNGHPEVSSMDDSCKPRDLPPNLEQLELLWPNENVIDWAEDFKSRMTTVAASDSPSQELFTNFRKLTLTCRDDAGLGASYFTEGVSKLWWTLSAIHGIEAEVHDQLRSQTFNLAELYDDEASDEEDSDTDDDDMDGNGWEDEDVRDQTNVLTSLMRPTLEEEGLFVHEIAENLTMDMQLVINAVQRLRDAGNVLASTEAHLSSESRVRLIKVSRDLQRIDAGSEQGQVEADDNGSGIRIPSSCLRYLGELPDPPPSAVSAMRIVILRTLRDLPYPSTGLTENHLQTMLNRVDSQAAETGDGISASIRRAIDDLCHAGFIRTESAQSAPGRRVQVFVKPSIELLNDDHQKVITATDTPIFGANNDDWEDDNDTDVDMPDLETFDPTSGVTIGPAIAPLSRVGQVTETALLRFIRQCGPSGVTHEEAASRLGTSYEEIMFRAAHLRRQGHVREDENQENLHFLSENAELLVEDRN